jgi:hypothetical protein
MAERYYGGIVWTNHALSRLSDRRLTQKMVYTAFQYPDNSLPLDNHGTMQYQKSFGSSVITVVAKKNDAREWVVISFWIDPPLPGSTDERKKIRYQKYMHSGFWGKLWMHLKRAMFNQDF